LGLATAGELISVGLHCSGAVRSGIGATLTQGSPFPRNNALTLNLLAQGFAPAQVLGQLRENDPDFQSRQVAIVDREGRTVSHTGARTTGWAGHRQGAGYVAMGDQLSGDSALAPLAELFESSAGLELEERLLKALEGVREPQRLRSVALIVFGNQDYSDTDLRVDLHDEPIAALRRLYDEYQPFAAYYLERARNPRNALPQREFADMLNARRTKDAS